MLPGNHSFDHYFGSYSGLPSGYGIPPGYTNPNGSGGKVKPFHFTNLTDNGQDPYHEWQDIHSEWDNGKMDGFYTTNGKAAMGYYKATDLPYYYSLFPKYTLCANYFCGEHPPANIHTGESMIKSIISAVQKSTAWSSTAILVTYDEGGGFFDHIAPEQLDAFGPGIRVPMIIVSPYAKAGHVDTTFSDHSSVLKFIETVFGLPTLTSVNHQFDTSTPKGSNYQADGAPFPPRDGNAALSDLTQCSTFG